MPHELREYLIQTATEKSYAIMESNFKNTIQSRFKTNCPLICFDDLKDSQFVTLFFNLALGISLFNEIGIYQERC